MNTICCFNDYYMKVIIVSVFAKSFVRSDLLFSVMSVIVALCVNCQYSNLVFYILLDKLGLHNISFKHQHCNSHIA